MLMPFNFSTYTGPLRVTLKRMFKRITTAAKVLS